MWSWTDLIALYSRQSCASSFTCDETDFGKSFMYKRNMNGACTVPCGTPHST